jgi:hypothetical protein
MKSTRAWVSRDFHKLLKMQSAERGLSIIEYTDRLAKESVSFTVDKPRKKKGGSSVFFKW